ncbi:MAG: AAA family ATPase, partial [Dehalococcoidia bacterium]|nr:AAA family ATPase [Dehalococcoidia bacterium]
MNEQVRTSRNAGLAPARAEQLNRASAKRTDGNRFVGRERELSALIEPLQRGARDGSVAFVGGEPGIGKSRLLREVAEEARALGWLTLSGRAYDTEGMPAYLPFIEVIREHLLHAPNDLVAALAEGAPELCRLLPEIRERVGDVPEPATLGPEAERLRLFESISRFLIDIGRQSEANGLVVLLDDLHWADKTTVLLLQHFARQLAGVPVFVVAAFRPTDLEPGNPLLGVIPDLLRERLCTQITLGPLEPEHVQALIEGITGLPATPAVAASLTRETAGNPFFIEEVVRDRLKRGAGLSGSSVAGGGVPEGVRAVTGRRLSLLRPETKQALQSAAVLGDTFHFKLLSAATELEAGQLMDAVEEAGRAGVLRQEGDAYAFTHALIRQTVYDELSVPRRQHLHLRAAEAIESFGTAIQGAGLAAIGYHWQLAGRPECAFEYLLRAGEAAVPVAAWEEASRHWQAALDCMEQAGEPPRRRARLLEGIGDLDFLSSLEAQSCIAHYDRARDLYKAAGDVVGAARASLRAGRSLAYPTSTPDFEGAVDYLREAESVLKATPDSLELGELYTALGHAESHQLRDAPEQLLTWIQRLQAVAERLDSDYLRISACSLEGHYAGLRGELARGLALEERACEWALEMKDLAANKWQQQWHQYLLGY